MANPFVGEIRMFGGNFAPSGWAFCNGALLPIAENEVLYTLMGTTYGGDGLSTFALPNLQSRIPIHVGPGFVLGQTGGQETVTLTNNQIPVHSHIPQANSGPGNQASPANGVWAQSTLGQYSSAVPSVNMDPSTMSVVGGSQPHDNMMPFLAVNFIISLFGIFPSQN